MASVPFHCEKCHTRRSPSEPISALGNLAVGLCCSLKDLGIKEYVNKKLVGGYEALDFGDLMEHFKFRAIIFKNHIRLLVLFPGVGWWQKDLSGEKCFIVGNLEDQYWCTEPIDKNRVDMLGDHKDYVMWRFLVAGQSFSDLKNCLFLHLKENI